MLYDTIVAISTGASNQAISIVRMSGSESLSIINKIFSKDLSDAKTHTIHYGYIKDHQSEEVVDEVLVSLFRSPKTFTKEDVIEINCHGGTFVTHKILQLCISSGARMATAGEFSKRAFLNGRIDLTQAEAIQDIISADSEAKLRLAIHEVRGSVKQMLEPLIAELLDIIANIEVNIDYPEYDDVIHLTSDILLPKTKEWLVKIDAILKTANNGKIIKDGIKTAIVGKPNVGKSSLLNALLEEDKAIVSSIEGTTRDVVEGYVRIGDITLHLLDTAGIRETKDEIEKIGIQRSLQAMEEAQLVIVVLDGSKELENYDQELLKQTEHKNRIIVYNKKDLSNYITDEIQISANLYEIQPLLQKIEELYQFNTFDIHQPMLANDRQIALLKRARNSMIQAQEAMKIGMELDLVDIDLEQCYTSLKEILGEVHKDDLLDTLFTNFCLGK